MKSVPEMKTGRPAPDTPFPYGLGRTGVHELAEAGFGDFPALTGFALAAIREAGGRAPGSGSARRRCRASTAALRAGNGRIRDGSGPAAPGRGEGADGGVAGRRGGLSHAGPGHGCGRAGRYGFHRFAAAWPGLRGQPDTAGPGVSPHAVGGNGRTGALAGLGPALHPSTTRCARPGAAGLARDSGEVPPAAGRCGTCLRCGVRS